MRRASARLWGLLAGLLFALALAACAGLSRDALCEMLRILDEEGA